MYPYTYLYNKCIMTISREYKYLKYSERIRSRKVRISSVWNFSTHLGTTYYLRINLKLQRWWGIVAINKRNQVVQNIDDEKNLIERSLAELNRIVSLAELKSRYYQNTTCSWILTVKQNVWKFFKWNNFKKKQNY